MIKSITWFALLIAAFQQSLFATPTKDGVQENAPYIVLKTGKNYEIRTYPEAKWVCKERADTQFTVLEEADCLFSLYEYMMGENVGATKMSMTWPLTVQTMPMAGDSVNSLFEMCLYIPKMYQNNPPVPIGQGVKIFLRPTHNFAVRQFNASMLKETDWAPETDALRSDLKAAGEANMDWDDIYEVSYDTPFKADTRRCEVWILKDE